MTNRIHLALVMVFFVVAGCTTSTSSNREISSYSEARAYADCVISRTRSFSSQAGSPVDIGYAAVASCRPQRNAMERALRADNSPVFVEEFMLRNDRTMLELATEAVARSRQK